VKSRLSRSNFIAIHPIPRDTKTPNGSPATLAASMTAMPCSAAWLKKVDHFLFRCAYESAEKEHATVCRRDRIA